MQTLANTLSSFSVPDGIPFYDPAEDELRDRERRRYNALRKSGIPQAFWGADLSQCPSEVIRWVAAIKEGGSAPLVLKGDVGRGKTYAACAAMIALMPEVSCKFSTFSAIAREIRGTFGSIESESDVLRRYLAPRALCLDDMGKTKPTDWNVELLFEIINDRWSNGKPTIYTTQYGGQELMGRMMAGDDPESAKATISRMMNNAVLVTFTGKDRRLA